MHGLRTGLADRVEDLVHHQITFGGDGGADMHRLVGHLDMGRVGVGVGIDGDGLDAHAAGGFHNTTGDLAPVGDQDFLEHAHPHITDDCLYRRRRGWRKIPSHMQHKSYRNCVMEAPPVRWAARRHSGW